MKDLTYRLRLADDFGVSELGIIVYTILAVAAVMLAGFICIVYGGRAYGRTTCAHWGGQTGIPTKFAILNWADSGTCLARTPDGRWVLNSKWQAFVSGSAK